MPDWLKCAILENEHSVLTSDKKKYDEFFCAINSLPDTKCDASQQYFSIQDIHHTPAAAAAAVVVRTHCFEEDIVAAASAAAEADCTAAVVEAGCTAAEEDIVAAASAEVEAEAGCTAAEAEAGCTVAFAAGAEAGCTDLDVVLIEHRLGWIGFVRRCFVPPNVAGPREPV